METILSTTILYRAQYTPGTSSSDVSITSVSSGYMHASFRLEAPFHQGHPLLDHFLKGTSNNNPLWQARTIPS